MSNDQNPGVESEKQLLKAIDSRDNAQLEPVLLNTPFKKVAMALSGGGFRAGAFSLGAMSYLHHLKYPDETHPDSCVLDNVQFVSSASGGSLAGILYSMHVRQGIPFPHTYRKLLDFMTGQVSLDQVLETLNDEEQWKGEKARNLINAFSKIYNEKLFDHNTFDVYWPREKESVDRQLEVCFNATEFYRGISFRFQAPTFSASGGVTGNKYVYFDKRKPTSAQTLRMIRLGDIMAASSCFPAGLEPIMLPNDFTYTSSVHGAALDTDMVRDALVTTDYNNKALKPSVNVGLMDGGVDDNQGLYSAMLADKRRRDKNPDNGFDLIFVTDVASYFMDPYEDPQVSTDGQFRKESITSLLDTPVKTFLPGKNKLISRLFYGSIALLLASALMLTLDTRDVFHDVYLILTTTFSLTSMGLGVVKYLIFGHAVKSLLPSDLSLPEEQTAALLKKSVPAFRNFSDHTLGGLVKYLQKTPTGVLEQMIKARVNSMLSMVLDVNLKQTRRLIFDLFYGAFYGEKIWQNRRIFNVIYELSTFNIESRNKSVKAKFQKNKPVTDNTALVNANVDLLTKGCESLNKVAESARTMATTLWFDETDVKNHRMRDVLACGQFTTCAQLLEHVLAIEDVLFKQASDPNFEQQIRFDEKQSAIFYAIKSQLLADWQKFKLNPYFLADQLAEKN
jgi:predicted acylesterase/phospholipase RssA